MYSAMHSPVVRNNAGMLRIYVGLLNRESDEEIGSQGTIRSSKGQKEAVGNHPISKRTIRRSKEP